MKVAQLQASRTSALVGMPLLKAIAVAASVDYWVWLLWLVAVVLLLQLDCSTACDVSGWAV